MDNSTLELIFIPLFVTALFWGWYFDSGRKLVNSEDKTKRYFFNGVLIGVSYLFLMGVYAVIVSIWNL